MIIVVIVRISLLFAKIILILILSTVAEPLDDQGGLGPLKDFEKNDFFFNILNNLIIFK